MLNLFVSPSLVFDEVMATSGRPANWIVPAALVCLSSLLVLNATTGAEQTAAAIQQLLVAGSITQPEAATLNAHWRMISRVATCLCVFLGVFWSAFVLWFIGRVFLRSRFPFSKALEVAGLSATVLVLGTVVTGLLALAAGDALARPAVSLLVYKLEPASRVRAACEVLNCFYLWTTAAMAIGLSRLSGAGLKDSAFWVFGYWVVARIGLILLA